MKIISPEKKVPVKVWIENHKELSYLTRYKASGQLVDLEIKKTTPLFTHKPWYMAAHFFTRFITPDL